MRFLIKLILAAVAIAALMPFLGPDTSVGKLVRAAVLDASGFCQRNPDACANGALIARDAHDLIASTIASIQGETGLTDADRALAPDAPLPDQTIPPSGAPVEEAFAGHGGAILD